MSDANHDDLIAQIIAAFGGNASGLRVDGAVVAGQDCSIYITADHGIGVSTTKGLKFTSGDLARFARMTLGMTAGRPPAANDNSPVDLWAERAKPSLPVGLLPPVIETFARERAEQMGVDPGGIAMAALAVCAAAIPDTVKLQVKEHDPDWLESARLWVALIGAPSTKKTPIISAAARPLKAIDGRKVADYLAACAAHAGLSKDVKAATPRPRQVRSIIEDTTVESAQEILADNPAGLLVLRDEMSGWFGSMERYGSTKGAAADRSFWLEAFNGGAHTTNRIGRGLVHVPNLSVCLLGGIQPEPMRAIAADAHDDGLLQRILPIVLGNSRLGRDEPLSPSSGAYTHLVERLHALRPAVRMIGPVPAETHLRFDEPGQDCRRDMEARHHALAQTWEAVNKKLSAHFGKYDSFFARLCVVFHCIETGDATPAPIIDGALVERVAQFLHGYLYRHALAFYGNVLGLSDRHDQVLATAGYILAHEMETISVSEARRGCRTMRKMNEAEAVDVLSQLDAFGWLDADQTVRNQTSARWKVRRSVHDLFEDRAEAEAARRLSVREAIIAATTQDGAAA